MAQGAKILTPWLLLILPFSHASGKPEDRAPVYEKPAFIIKGQRQLELTGIQRSVLDSLALREEITKSLADVLSRSSTVFIKSYGRGTLSTASFRGTAPSHTQVTWNGMRINSPMVGMVDFSLVPSYLVDNVALYHGASSIGIAGGGLGGAVTLSGKAEPGTGPGINYIQGIGSFDTYDQFLKVTYGGEKFRGSTRLNYAVSDNDFKYTNYRKKDYVFDGQGAMIGSVYPVERNRNGNFRDFHILQDMFYRSGKDRFSLSVWQMVSRRGVPMLNVDYKEGGRSKNLQEDNTLRVAAGWDRDYSSLTLSGKTGYSYTDLRYRYLGDPGTGELLPMIHSRSFVHTGFARAGADYHIGSRWMFSANLTAYQNSVSSVDRAVISSNGQNTVAGYSQARPEFSLFGSVKYRPWDRWSFAVSMRGERYGEHTSPIIPAGFAQYLISERWNLVLKTSAARNFRYPTLNDLYFMPGGNPDLKPESGFTYDTGLEFTIGDERLEVRGEVTWYDSRIDDWILWLPTFKGFWSPVNVKQVHSYGMELKGRLKAFFGAQWKLDISSNFTISKAINNGDAANWNDRAVGKQLVYIPERSGAINGRLFWRDWGLGYSFSGYSERFTTSSNETATRIGILPAYYMSDLSLEKGFETGLGRANIRLAVNNIFDEEYESVLSRPMPGRNYSIFLEIKPRLKRERK